jgi:hypothetical protein
MMSMKAKISAALAVFVAALLVGACGPADSTPNSSTPMSSQQAPCHDADAAAGDPDHDCR